MRKETRGHCTPKPTVSPPSRATPTSCSSVSFLRALTPQGQGIGGAAAHQLSRPRAPGARDARSQSTCSAGPRALGAGRPHLASAPGAAGRSLGFHLRRRAAQPGVWGPRGGPARGAHGMEHVARGEERSWGRRRLSGFFAQATGRLWNLRSGFQGVPSGRRGQCVTVMSVRRGGSLATPSPGPAPADGSRASDSDSDSDSGAWVCGSQRRARGRRPGGRMRPGRGKAVRNHEKVHGTARIKRGIECPLNISIKRSNLKRWGPAGQQNLAGLIPSSEREGQVRAPERGRGSGSGGGFPAE